MIVAIDPSLTGTAIVRGSGNEFECQRFTSANCGDDVINRIYRYETMIDAMITWLSDHVTYDAIYIEAYSYGSNDARSKFTAEFGGILRFHLTDLSDRIPEVAPTTLKKFCAGNGAAKKDMVAAHLSHRYGVMFDDSDSFDAFGLYRLGLCAEGLAEAQNRAQQEAVDRVLGIERPKPKKSRRTGNPLDDLLGGDKW